jgi:hypothetical protein
LAGLVLPLFITKSLSLAPVPVPHAGLGIFWALCCGSLMALLGPVAAIP